MELLQSSDFKVKENPNDVTAVSKTITRTVQVSMGRTTHKWGEKDVAVCMNSHLLVTCRKVCQ